MGPAIGSAAAALVGYGLGSIPSADVAARAAGAGPDALRTAGTGNPGGMNVGYVLGRGWGAAVSVADIFKGVAAAQVGRRLAGERGANLAATAAVLGHCHPVARRGGKGGKGVATSIGQVIGTFPAYLPIDVGVAAATAALPWFRRRTETATTVASFSWVACGLAFWHQGWSCGLRRSTALAVPVCAATSAVVIHRRFRAGSERVDSFNDATGASR
jgi:glycerol-3-phosphate acyltransferase PlsY